MIMEKFIDMHCHILPEVDDGAKDMEETKAMLEMAYADGIRYIIATPHCHPRRGRTSIDRIQAQAKRVRQVAKQIDEKFGIFLGQEVYFGQDVPDLLVKDEILTMNRRDYVLVEFSPSDEGSYIKQGIQQIQSRGYIVILAHVERYANLRDDMELVENLCETGVLLQVNASSILGDKGRAVKKFVQNLLKEEMVFCVGTDAHDLKHRPPQMKKAAEYVAKKYGEEYARRIFFSNAAKMLKKQK